MKTTTTPFDLRAWRWRLRLTQKDAAAAVGLSTNAYCRAEYRCQDRAGQPVNATLALLCQALELLRATVDQIEEPRNAEHTLGAFCYGTNMAEARRLLGRQSAQEAA